MTAPGPSANRICCIQSWFRAACIEVMLKQLCSGPFAGLFLPPLPLLTQLCSRAAAVMVWRHSRLPMLVAHRHDMPVCVSTG